MDEGQEKEASAKLAQHLAVAVQIAEAVTRLRQQATDRDAAGIQRAAAAARAERTAQHTADRVVFSPALDPHWTADADLRDLGQAWGAAAGWADTDPTADVAATRVEDQLRDRAPTAMARFDELRDTGTDRHEAMRDVLTNIAAESSYQPRVFIGEPGQNQDATAAEAGAFLGRRVTETGQPHPVDVAAESFPHPYAQVTPATAGTALVPATTVKSRTRTLTR